MHTLRFDPATPMPVVTVNYLAVLAAAVLSMVVGYIWYHRRVFGTAWMRHAGMTEAKARKDAGMAMVSMFLVALVANYVLAHFIDYTYARTFAAGMRTGLWAWLGFSGPVFFTIAAFERRPVQWFTISAGYQLCVLLLNGGLLAVWT
jgi:hypothetical protein